LDGLLGKFYVEARTSKGELYRGTSLETLRYGFCRHIKGFNKQVDIIKDPEFNSSNELFKTAMTEVKASGKGDIKHTPAITPEDLEKLYAFFDTSNPQGLLDKVMFDTRLYCFRRGMENFEAMTKTTFEVVETAHGRCVVKKDGLTKNHREKDRENAGGVMPESPNNPNCPVRSFQLYVSRLHPQCDRLWQYPCPKPIRPVPNPTAEATCIWFQNRPLGKNKLCTFMADLSTAAGLGTKYTNHSVRATGATILAEACFSDTDIIAVTGHKTVASLSSYQKTSVKRKIEMAQHLQSLLQPQLNSTLQPAPLNQRQRRLPAATITPESDSSLADRERVSAERTPAGTTEPTSATPACRDYYV
jgi:hypothetical protein